MAYRSAPFYNLDASVGRGKPNQQDDVLLVQFLLHSLAQLRAGSPALDWTNRPRAPLVVNGQADATTFEWILSFQSTDAYQNVADGIVDPAPPQFWSLRTPRRNAVYTIVSLNGLMESLLPDLFFNLHRDPAVPANLRNAIRPGR